MKEEQYKEVKTRMRRLSLSIAAAVAAASLVIAGCSQAAPAPAPTTAPAAPTKAAAPPAAAAPTKAPAQPTAAPATKVDWPQKGKTVTVIVPYDAGGPTDVAARLLSVSLEKELGTSVQVVNKPGAGSQVGITELAKSKPDGYTIAYTVIPAVNTAYLDPQRKAAFGRKDLVPLAVHVIEPDVLRVKADSPFKTPKDIIDEAKAKPEKVKMGVTGILGPPHIDILQWQKMTDAKFAIVTFNGTATSMTALLGGHIDVQDGMASDVTGPDVRTLAVLDRQESKFLPGVKTLEAQGYKLYGGVIRGFSLPAGVPKEVVDVLSGATKRAMENPEHVKKMAETHQEVQYKGPEEFAALWDERDEQLKPLVAEFKQ